MNFLLFNIAISGDLSTHPRHAPPHPNNNLGAEPFVLPRARNFIHFGRMLTLDGQGYYDAFPGAFRCEMEGFILWLDGWMDGRR